MKKNKQKIITVILFLLCLSRGSIVSALEVPQFVSGPEVIKLVNGLYRITATLDEPVRAKLEYGKTSKYGNSMLVEDLRTALSFDLPDLQGGISYHYRLQVTDNSNNVTLTSDQIYTAQLSGNTNYTSNTIVPTASIAQGSLDAGNLAPEVTNSAAILGVASGKDERVILFAFIAVAIIAIGIYWGYKTALKFQVWLNPKPQRKQLVNVFRDPDVTDWPNQRD